MASLFQKIAVTLIFVAYTLSVGWANAIYNYIVMNSCFGWRCSKERHDRKVKAVQAQIKIWAAGNRKQKLCSARPSWKSISVIKVNKSGYYQVELGPLDDVVEIDEKNQVFQHKITTQNQLNCGDSV